MNSETLEAKVARLEQECDEAHANTNEGLQWLRDDIAVKVETIASLEAALAVAREREQRLREAAQALVDAWGKDAAALVLAEHGLRAALVDEPAAGRIESREGMVTVYDFHGRYVGCMGAETWENLLADEPAARTERCICKHHRGYHYDMGECFSAYCGCPGFAAATLVVSEATDVEAPHSQARCDSGSASAAAEEPCWVVGCSEQESHVHVVTAAGTLEVHAAADEPGETTA